MASTSTLPPLIQAFSGALGSALANAGSYPLDLVTTKVQTSSTKNQGHGLQAAVRILRRVTENRGWSGLYDGLEADTGATLLSNFFYFYAHSFLRFLLLKHKHRSLAPNAQSKQPPVIFSLLEELLIGFFAGVGSRLISTPLSLVTVRLQSEREKEVDELEHAEKAQGEGNDSTKGVVGVMRDLYAEGGLAGFWRGFSLTILLSCNPALTYAFTSLFLRAGKDRTRPSASQGFIAGASGNALAVCIIYPLILAKTRLSASAKRTTFSNVLRDSVKKDGVKGLYQGLEVQVLKGFLNQGLTIMTKQRIEYRFIQLYKVFSDVK